jgi:hypothetical protein
MLMARDLSNQNLGSVCKLLAMTDSLHLWWETDRLPCNSSLTGVDEPISSGLEASLFPNPSHDLVTLLFANPKSMAAELRVLDITGREALARQTAQGDRFVVDVRDLSSGVYFIQLTCGQRSFVGKFVRN